MASVITSLTVSRPGTPSSPPAHGPAGTHVEITGTGFKPGTTMKVFFDGGTNVSQSITGYWSYSTITAAVPSTIITTPPNTYPFSVNVYVQIDGVNSNTFPFLLTDPEDPNDYHKDQPTEGEEGTGIILIGESYVDGKADGSYPLYFNYSYNYSGDYEEPGFPVSDTVTGAKYVSKIVGDGIVCIPNLDNKSGYVMTADWAFTTDPGAILRFYYYQTEAKVPKPFPAAPQKYSPLLRFIGEYNIPYSSHGGDERVPYGGIFADIGTRKFYALQLEQWAGANNELSLLTFTPGRFTPTSIELIDSGPPVDNEPSYFAHGGPQIGLAVSDNGNDVYLISGEQGREFLDDPITWKFTVYVSHSRGTPIDFVSFITPQQDGPKPPGAFLHNSATQDLIFLLFHTENEIYETTQRWELQRYTSAAALATTEDYFGDVSGFPTWIQGDPWNPDQVWTGFSDEGADYATISKFKSTDFSDPTFTLYPYFTRQNPNGKNRFEADATGWTVLSHEIVWGTGQHIKIITTPESGKYDITPQDAIPRITQPPTGSPPDISIPLPPGNGATTESGVNPDGFKFVGSDLVATASFIGPNDVSLGPAIFAFSGPLLVPALTLPPPSELKMNLSPTDYRFTGASLGSTFVGSSGSTAVAPLPVGAYEVLGPPLRVHLPISTPIEFSLFSALYQLTGDPLFSLASVVSNQNAILGPSSYNFTGFPLLSELIASTGSTISVDHDAGDYRILGSDLLNSTVLASYIIDLLPDDYSIVGSPLSGDLLLSGGSTGSAVFEIGSYLILDPALTATGLTFSLISSGGNLDASTDVGQYNITGFDMAGVTSDAIITRILFNCINHHLTIIGDNFISGSTIILKGPDGQDVPFTVLSTTKTRIILDLHTGMITPGQYCVTVVN